jgi:hypothetical protein
MMSCLPEATVPIPFDRLQGNYRHYGYAVNDPKEIAFSSTLTPCRSQYCGRRTTTATPSCGP